MSIMYRLKFIFLCYFLNFQGTICAGKRILFFIGISSYSHRDCMQPLANRMAELGHHVTFFAPMKHAKTHPKILEFCIPEMTQANLAVKNMDTMTATNRLKDRKFDPVLTGDTLHNFYLFGAQICLQSPEFHQWFASNTFDLFVLDYLGKEFLLPYAHKMKAKVVFLNPTDVFLPENIEAHGFPLEPWLETVDQNVYRFPWRIYNAYKGLTWLWSYHTHFLPKMEAMVKAAIPFEHPPIQELMRRTDLILINEWNSGRSYPPYVIQVGGLHVTLSNGTLSKELEIFLENAEQFIYISLGTFVQATSLPPEFMQILYDVVASLGPKTKFLWKWDGEIPKGMPKNVRIQSWFEQQDVLAHPKCKGFVTQGGLLSVQQAIYNHVPLLVIPILADQPLNARRVQKKGCGIYLELADITRETFGQALKELLFNPKYAKNMNEESLMFRDRPEQPLDTAVWWLEYVLRRNTSRFKPWESLSLSWWQRRLLDIWAVVFLIICVVILGIMYALIRVCAIFAGRGGNKSKLKTH